MTAPTVVSLSPCGDSQIVLVEYYLYHYNTGQMSQGGSREKKSIRRKTILGV